MTIFSIIEYFTFLKKLLFLYLLYLYFFSIGSIFGVEVKGAKRWLDPYFFRLQPIEFLKPFFILANCKNINFR